MSNDFIRCTASAIWVSQSDDDRYGSAHGVFDAGAFVWKDSRLFVLGGIPDRFRPPVLNQDHGRADEVCIGTGTDRL